MMPEKILESVYLIQSGLPGNSNCIFIDDALKCLVDTGAATGLKAHLRQLRTAGLEPERLDVIVNTHLHADHIGGNAYFAGVATGLAIQVHSAGLGFVGHGERREWYRGFLESDNAFPVQRALEDGDAIRLGEYTFFVHHTPGHSPDSICLHDPGHRLLLSGDTLLFEDVGTINARRDFLQNLETFENSILRLRRLAIDIIVPGHGRVIRDPGKNFDFVLEKIGKFRRSPVSLAKHMIDKCLLPVCAYYKTITKKKLFDLFVNSDWFAALQVHVRESELLRWLERYLGALVVLGILEEDRDATYHFLGQPGPAGI